MNYNIKIDLNKMPGSRRVGSYISIPIDGDVIDRDGYLNLVAFDLRHQASGQSHLIKPKLPESTIKNMLEEQYRRIPYIGNMRSWEAKK